MRESTGLFSRTEMNGAAIACSSPSLWIRILSSRFASLTPIRSRVRKRSYSTPSAEAQRKDELGEYYEHQAAMSGSNLAAALLSERVIAALRTEVRAQTGHRTTKEDPAIALIERVVCPEAQDSDVAKLVKRAGRLE